MASNLDDFKEKLNSLLQKVASGDAEFKFPPGQTEGFVAFPIAQDQYDYLFTYQPTEGGADHTVEVHLFPAKNPRTLYDQLKESALKPDTFGKIAGWVEGPSGFPSRNEYDDVRMCGAEGDDLRHVRWVQQKEGSEGGYLVRLETTAEAPNGHLKNYADALWWIVNQIGYYNPLE